MEREKDKETAQKSAVFLLPQRKFYSRMNTIISPQGNYEESLIEIHYSLHIFVGLQGSQDAIPRLWWRSTRTLERYAFSLTNCLRFVTGTLETVSCFDTQSAPSRKVKSEEDKQRFEKGDSSLVNERWAFVNFYACDWSDRLIDQNQKINHKCQFRKHLKNLLERISF